MDDRLATYLKTRRTIPAAQLGEPGPDPATLRDMLTIAARVPDHGKLAPWRFIVFDQAAREQAIAGLVKIAERHPDEKERQIPGRQGEGLRRRAARRRRDLLADRRSSENPALGAAAFRRRRRASTSSTPRARYGFSAQWLTGWYAYDEEAKAWLGLKPGEQVAGFLHIGTPTVPPTERDRPDVDEDHDGVDGGSRKPRSRSRSARASSRSAALRCGRSSILPSSAITPAPPASAKAATICSARAIASADGVKASLMISTWSGWIASLPEKPSRAAAAHSRLSPSMSRKSV